MKTENGKEEQLLTYQIQSERREHDSAPAEDEKVQFTLCRLCVVGKSTKVKKEGWKHEAGAILTAKR